MKDDVKRDEYRLVELTAENFKRLKAIRIRPDGRVVQITGKNGAGKTSVLDAFAAAVGGKAMCPAVPIRKGQKTATVSADLSGLRVTRTFRLAEDGSTPSTLTVEYADGSRPKHPQAVLDELRGTDLAVDPLEFTRLAPKDQADVLKSLVPGVDFAAMAKRRRELFEERTQTGRMRDRADSAAKAITVPDDAPAQPVDVTALATDLDNAGRYNTQINERQARRTAAQAEAESKRDMADQLRARAKQADAEADEIEAKLKAAEKLPDLVDTRGLMAKIQKAQYLNDAHALLAGRDTFRKEAADHSEQYAKLTSYIDGVDADKAAALAAAKLPVKGLTFDDDGVLLDGVPFGQASAAEQLRTSTALAMALKPKLKVILVRDGSLLDEDSMKVLADMAEKHGFVVLLERVATGQRVGVVIEDGEVAQ